MKYLIITLLFAGVIAIGGLSAKAADAAAERTVEERLEDIEAYMNNVARNASTNSATKIPGPGPGHNA